MPDGAGENVAVTAEFAVRVMLHVPVPVHEPLQPLNTDPLAGVAARVMLEPDEAATEHVAPQLIPAGVLVTVPVPPLELVLVTFSV